MNCILKKTFTVPVHYYINSSFDLDLGSWNISEKLRRGTSQFASLIVPAAENRDSVILDFDVNSDYREYLFDIGLSPAKIVSNNNITSYRCGMAWGWNKFAKDYFDNFNISYNYPTLEAVKLVNSRKFCYEINRKTDTGVAGTFFCTSFEELNEILKKYKSKLVVIKAEFGSAGMGFIRGEANKLSEDKILKLFSTGSGVLIEPWLNRTFDISSGFQLSKNGTIEITWHHRSFCSSAGVYYANLIISNDKIIDRYKEMLEKTIKIMARELSKVGYFGPVGFDSFEYLDENGIINFAVGIEINARMNAGMFAHATHAKIAFRKPGLFRAIAKKKHNLPETYSEFKKLLGDLAYNFKTEKGVILLSPLRVRFEKKWIRTARSNFAIIADTEDELLELDSRLRTSIA